MQPQTVLITSMIIVVSFSLTDSLSTASSYNHYGNNYNPNATEFIRINCETTLYPTLCFQLLVGYANTVQKEPARLARVAIGVSLARAKSTARYMANLTRRADYGLDPQATSAVRDCFSVMSDAVDQIRASLRQMRRLTVGEQLRFELGNVQTWMSAAITYEDTCTDGFEELDYDNDDSVVKAEVVDRIVKVKEVTSNALALVNGFAAKIITS